LCPTGTVASVDLPLRTPKMPAAKPVEIIH